MPELIPGHKGSCFPGNKNVFIFVGFRVPFQPLFSMDLWLLLGERCVLAVGGSWGYPGPAFGAASLLTQVSLADGMRSTGVGQRDMETESGPGRLSPHSSSAY